MATTDTEGVRRVWHVLDTHAGQAPAAGSERGTLLCVHGNPTWSYLWRHVLAGAPHGWRVVAPDALGMGWSERLETPRTLDLRVADLGALTAELGIEGPVVTVAHDWGGPISLGWALAHQDLVRGVVLFNTAVHQPVGAGAPAVIRLARTAVLRTTLCVRTPSFVRAATALSVPRLSADVRAAFAAPYATPARRQAVGDFVLDIPLESNHPSMAALERIRDGLGRLANVPALLLWGPRDPVFSDRYLRDLLARLPHADVHRYEGASHLVTEDAPQSARAIASWVADTLTTAKKPRIPAPAAANGRAFWAAMSERSGDGATAIMELGPAPRRVSFAQLDARVRDLASGLAAAGVGPGHRVALLVPPGADLAATLYACWRIGAIVVVADAGLGVRSLGRALRGAGPDYIVGISRGLVAAAALRVPGSRIVVGPVSPAERRLLSVTATLDELAVLGRRRKDPTAAPAPHPSPQLVDGGWAKGIETNRQPAIASEDGAGAMHLDDADCAVIFTSGATGPAKGVVYRHRQLRAQLQVLRSTYAITSRDRLVAAFAPFALYGPMLGIASAVPDVDVTAPSGLTASALAAAVAAIDATLVFASPSALRNVVATSGQLQAAERRALGGVRLVMSAGAPVPVSLLRAVHDLLPAASLHTPYGMTEVLPVTDICLAEIEAAGDGNGVCVGRPVIGVQVAVSPLGPDGVAEGPPLDAPGVTGEVCVRAAHTKDRYDRLWSTEHESSRNAGWHRTSDVGHLDSDGRLWIEGRLAHIVVTADGVVSPVGVEQRIERLAGVRSAAVVGVGPRGTQQAVVVVVHEEPAIRGPLADVQTSEAVRRVAGVDVAAVLATTALPVDIRHQSKIDRVRVAAWAHRVLSGARAGREP